MSKKKKPEPLTPLDLLKLPCLALHDVVEMISEWHDKFGKIPVAQRMELRDVADKINAMINYDVINYDAIR